MEIIIDNRETCVIDKLKEKKNYINTTIKYR